jgi:glycosyltransferase involved in cell wall biosynthesis
MNFSIVIPSQGRESVHQAVGSVLAQFHPQDELIVVFDGAQRALPVHPKLRVLATEGGPHKDWGSAARSLGIRHAIGDWLLMLDDDDEMRPDAILMARKAIAEDGPYPYLFRVLCEGGMIIWEDKEIREQNVTTQSICFPNWPRRLGKWSSRYGHDLDFIRDTATLWPADSIVWREEILIEKNRNRPPGAPMRRAADVGILDP